MSYNVLTKGTALVGDILLTQSEGSTATKKIIKEHIIRLGAGGTQPTSSETATVFTLPGQAVLYDAYINVLAASTGATKTLNVGLLASSAGGNNAGFLLGISAASSGLAYPSVSTATSGAGTGARFYTTNTWGAFLSVFSSGSTGNATNADIGYYQQKVFLSDSVTAKTVTFTPATTDWIGLFKADLVLSYVDLTL